MLVGKTGRGGAGWGICDLNVVMFSQESGNHCLNDGILSDFCGYVR